jgi:hypothetical protein
MEPKTPLPRAEGAEFAPPKTTDIGSLENMLKAIVSANPCKISSFRSYTEGILTSAPPRWSFKEIFANP